MGSPTPGRNGEGPASQRAWLSASRGRPITTHVIIRQSRVNIYVSIVFCDNVIILELATPLPQSPDS
jgi:hypothetical protein